MLALPAAGVPAVFRGYVIIEWPPPRAGLAPMAGWGISVFDAADGTQITTATRIEITADASNLVTAVLTMFADEDGNPLTTGPPRACDGEIMTGIFRYYVAEMRTRPAAITGTSAYPALHQ
jgi:hypothetical protein